TRRGRMERSTRPNFVGPHLDQAAYKGICFSPPRGRCASVKSRGLKSLNNGVETRLGRTGMYKHILISTDGSEVAQKGVDHGLSLAKSLGARVTVIMVTERFPVSVHNGIAGGWIPGPEEMARYEARQKEFAQEVLAAVEAAAKKLGVPADTVHVPEAYPAEAI